MKDITQAVISAGVCILNASILIGLIWGYIYIENLTVKHYLDSRLTRFKAICEKVYPIAILEDTNTGLKITWKEDTN